MRSVFGRAGVAILVLVLAGPTAGCGGNGGNAAELVVKGYQFAPLTVASGAEIKLVNQDDEPHTMTAADKAFDSGPFSKDKPGKVKAPGRKGEYAYGCTVHPVMKGTLKIK